MMQWVENASHSSGKTMAVVLARLIHLRLMNAGYFVDILTDAL